MGGPGVNEDEVYKKLSRMNALEFRARRRIT
jgi:hypothetical protein